MKNDKYCSHCGQYPGLVRMEKIGDYVWSCSCGVASDAKVIVWHVKPFDTIKITGISEGVKFKELVGDVLTVTGDGYIKLCLDESDPQIREEYGFDVKIWFNPANVKLIEVIEQDN